MRIQQQSVASDANHSSEQDSSDDDDDDDDVRSSLNKISFGALARAQATLGKRKRTAADDDGAIAPSSIISDIRNQIREACAQKRQSSGADHDHDHEKDKSKSKSKSPSVRSSKHAPTIQSS